MNKKLILGIAAWGTAAVIGGFVAKAEFPIVKNAIGYRKSVTPNDIPREEVEPEVPEA